MEESVVDEQTPTRRGLLAKAVAAVPLVAVGSGLAPLSRFFPASWASTELTDYDLVGFAQTIELAIAKLYSTAASKLSGSQATLASTFGSHHDTAATAFAGFFDAAGATAPGAPNQAFLSAFGGQVAAGGNATLAALAQIEEIAAATSYWAIGQMVNQAGARIFASVLPVAGQHAATLGILTGGSTAGLVPPFQTADKKVTPAEYPPPPPQAGGGAGGSGSAGGAGGSGSAGGSATSGGSSTGSSTNS